MYCDHCQITVAEAARFCLSCGGKLTDAPAVDAMDPSQAPTVALTIGPCESCGAPSLPGSTLCLPCTRAFESILGTQPQAPALPSAPVGSAPPTPTAPEDATVMMAAAVPHEDLLGDDPLGDDEEYEDEPDDVNAQEAATVLTPRVEPAAAPEAPVVSSFAATDAVDWSSPAATTNEHEGIVALPPWARKGPDADADAVPVAETATAAADPGGEPVPWWERNGQGSPTATAKPDTARYVPPPSATPPASASLESTLARQAMRPKSPSTALPPPVVTRPASSNANRSRTLVIGAALAGVAAIGTPVMWKLAFASRPTVVSALPVEPMAAPEPAAPRPERVHGAPAPAPAPAAESPRVYQDLQPLAAETPAPVAAPPAAATPAPAHTPKPNAPKKPAMVAASEPVAAPVVAPEPAPLLVATPPPVVAAPTAAAAPPASVQAEAVPLGQIFEVSQVDSRPAVTNRFDPVLPARLAGAATPVVVIVRVLVSPSGRAVESSPVKNPTNDSGVGAAAAATVRQWSFAAAKKKGQVVSCWFNVGVVFKSVAGN